MTGLLEELFLSIVAEGSYPGLNLTWDRLQMSTRHSSRNINWKYIYICKVWGSYWSCSPWMVVKT